MRLTHRLADKDDLTRLAASATKWRVDEERLIDGPLDELADDRGIRMLISAISKSPSGGT
jgi:hypothetical protein